MNSFYRELKAIQTLYILPVLFIIVFSFYIHFHGKISPGGGFQSGIVMSIAFIIRNSILILTGKEKKRTTSDIFGFFAFSGVFCYAMAGLVPVFCGGNIFDYSVFLSNYLLSQKIGIFLIETGVGLGVFGSVMLIYTEMRGIVR